MTKRVSVSAEGLGKRYTIGSDTSGTDEFWALREVSFSLNEGTALGIIGRNGSGKSTLLKILSGVVAPTAGRAELRGTLGSLLEVGAGFHPDLTGRENVFLNGSLLGLKRTEVHRQFDAIIDFAELEQFVDTPVKHYSSGMYMRLAFSVAAHLRTDILILDEVMAVGDAGFQKKCIDMMGQIMSDGRTVLFVSHSPWAIERFCTQAILLDHGSPLFVGSASDASMVYRKMVYGLPTTENASEVAVEHELPAVAELGEITYFERKRAHVIKTLSIERLDGTATAVFHTGEGIRARIAYEIDGVEPDGYFSLLFTEMTGDRAMTIHSTHVGRALHVSGRGEVECEIPELRLTGGYYSIMVDFGRYRDGTMENVDTVPDALRVFVNVGDYVKGIGHNRNHGTFIQKSEWTILPQAQGETA